MAEPKDKPDYWRPPKAGGRNYGGGSTPGPSGSRSKTSSPTAQTTTIKTAAAKKAAGGTAKKTAAKSAAKSGVKKAAAVEVAGGGPEDPVADVAAAGSLLSSFKSGAKKTADAAPSAGKAFSASNPRRWVLVEFLVCFVILGLGTIVAPEGKKNGGAGHLAVKGSALALLFFILGLMSGGGPKAAKGAGALGGLVTAAYVFTSQDSANVIAWISKFFDSGNSSAAASAGEAIGQAGAAAAAGAAVGNVAGAAE